MTMAKISSTGKKVLVNTAAVIGGLVLSRFALRALNKFKFKDKVVLITGGSRGLGLVMARQLVKQGAKVVVCARKEEELITSAEELSAETQNYLAIPCDITDKVQVKQMIEETENIMGPIDILINNASSIQVGPMETMTEEDYEEALKVHFWGPLYVINGVLPSMKLRQTGRIVNIVSIGGRLSFPHLLPYTASKYALAGLSEGMAVELKKDKIKVTTVYPGLMQTGSPKNIDVKGKHEDEYAWFKIADSLPVLSMSAEKAAKQILEAIKYGESTITLSFPAKLAVAMHDVAPGLTISMFDLINRFLPDTKGGSMVAKKGYESESKVTLSEVTRETEEAAVKNNEI